IGQLISRLAETKFLVRKDLEGLKLEEERLKIADRVLELISALANSRPVLLVLEDLHWADESSLFVLNYLIRNILSHKIMILATTRPHQEALENILSHGGTIMPLIGLETNGLAEILDEVYPGHSFPAEFTSQIIEQCDGNPFFFLELLRQIWVDGNVIAENGKFSLIDQTFAVPASVEDLVLKRLAGLDSQTMTLAEYSSCIGRTFKREEAQSIESVKEPTMAIERLIDSGIVLSNNGTVEFSHAIFQDVIYSGISGRWKLAYHKSLGEYYESAFEDSPSEAIYQLARHFFRSLEHDKAFGYCIGAGEKAESSFAAEQALGFYNDAYSLAQKLKDTGHRAEAEINLPVRLGDLYKFTGQLDTALESYGLALPRDNDARNKADILRKMAEVHLRRGEYEKSYSIGISGLELLNGQKSMVAEKLYNALGWTLIRTGKHTQALELLNKGLEIAIECNDRGGIASAEHNIGSVMLHKGEYETAIIHFDRALVIREEINDVWHKSSSLNNLGNSYLSLG
ncbi:MAG: tetratricopeptide repeat protein, partial [Thermoplasmata archaeon]|nr:tetratricopeptide repeat protein [Thermoplasmata archaeon]